jgi:3'(2'), 5'-bisphosphate nucleotidase
MQETPIGLSKEELLTLLNDAIDAALLAGEEILRIYESNFEVRFKADESPLTLADKNAHTIIVTSLAQTSIPIISEEGIQVPFAERKHWHRLWIVDPLDGTKEFVKRNGEFTVNIALVENQYPVLGVIYQPVTKLLFFAAKSIGAFRYDQNQKPAKTGSIMELARHLPAPPSSRPFTVAASRSHAGSKTDTFIQQLAKEHSGMQVSYAGSSIKFCLVAEGLADVYPRMDPTQEWDTAAGQAIVECTGGEVVDVTTGKRMTYNRENQLNASFIVNAASECAE